MSHNRLDSGGDFLTFASDWQRKMLELAAVVGRIC